MVVELGEGSSGETPKASKGGALGGVFLPINMIIANPWCKKIA